MQIQNYIGEIFGDYQLIKLLGKGGFADVYLGEHIHLKGTLVAVKLLKGPATPKALQEFSREAQRIIQWRHPNIVWVRNFSMRGNIPFIVMDYASNGTLRQKHPEGSVLPLATVLSYVKQVAAALQYAHDQKIIHRDIKPENMLVTMDDTVVLSDFGIAIVAHGTQSKSLQEIVGTISYMAPEQINGDASLASDQYALGVVVYEWLCGERPFEGANPAEIVKKQLLDSPPLLRKKNPSIPRNVEQVVLKALEKDSQQRFKRVQDFADALEQGIRQHLSSSTTISSSTKLPVTPAPLPSAPVPPQRHNLPRRQYPGGRRPIAPVPVPSQRHTISRRIVIGGLIGLIVAGVLGVGTIGIAELIIPSEKSNSSGTMFGFDLQRTNFNQHENVLTTGNVSQLASYWTTPTKGAILSSPTVTNGVAYVGSNDGNLYALDAATGNIRWKGPTDAAVISSPAVASGTVYVGSSDGNLYAFDAITGESRWTTPTKGAVMSSPVVTDGIVYVGSSDGNLYACDAATGNVRWTKTTGSAITSSPAIANGIIYIGSNNGSLYAYDTSTRNILWIAATGGAVTSGPTAANGDVYICYKDGNLHAFDTVKGASLWPPETASSLAVANNVIYAANLSGISALDSSTGNVFWTSSFSFAQAFLSSPIVANGVVYIATSDGSNGNLYALDASTTKPNFWDANPTGTILANISLGDNYHGDVVDNIGFVSSPTVSNGGLYVGSVDGNLYAFHLPGTTPS